MFLRLQVRGTMKRKLTLRVKLKMKPKLEVIPKRKLALRMMSNMNLFLLQNEWNELKLKQREKHWKLEIKGYLIKDS